MFMNAPAWLDAQGLWLKSWSGAVRESNPHKLSTTARLSTKTWQWYHVPRHSTRACTRQQKSCLTAMQPGANLCHAACRLSHAGGPVFYHAGQLTYLRRAFTRHWRAHLGRTC
jgi:hypothetical protein